MKTYRVLITGAAGAIGRAISRDLLAQGHFVRGLDLKENPQLSESVVGSITDPAVFDQAMDSMDTLIHLAAWTDDADFMSKLLPNNIVGLYNALEAARQHQVRRLILASSMQAIGGHGKLGREIRIADGPAPMNHYAATKAYAELLGQMYARKHELSVLAIRIGWFTRNHKEVEHMAAHPGARRSYLSHRDAGRFFLRAVEAENISFEVLFAVSREAQGHVELEASRRVLGYEPQNVFPQGLDFELSPEVQAAAAKLPALIQ